MFVALWPTCRGLDTVIERAQVFFLRSQEEGGVQPHQEMGKKQHAAFGEGGIIAYVFIVLRQAPRGN